MKIKYKGQVYQRVDATEGYKEQAREIFKEVDGAGKAYSRLFLIFKRELEPLKGKIKDFEKLEAMKTKCLENMNKAVTEAHEIVKQLMNAK